MPIRKAARLVWRLSSRRHFLAKPRPLRSLNVKAMSVSPDSKITIASTSVSVLGHLTPQPVRVRWYRILCRFLILDTSMDLSVSVNSAPVGDARP